MIRSVLAVLAGFLAMAAVVMITTPLLARALIPPGEGGRPGPLTPGYLAANLLVSALAALGGGYLAAAVARQAPLAHGGALAGLMFVLSVLSMRQAAGSQPRWYGLTLAVAMPLVAIGGALLRGS